MIYLNIKMKSVKITKFYKDYIEVNLPMSLWLLGKFQKQQEEHYPWKAKQVKLYQQICALQNIQWEKYGSKGFWRKYMQNANL